MNWYLKKKGADQEVFFIFTIAEWLKAGGTDIDSKYDYNHPVRVTMPFILPQLLA